jgi:hypothetical protein
MSSNLGKSDKPDMLTFFNHKLSRGSSQEDVELRSRSVSNASNGSISKLIRGEAHKNKKYGNLFALDGFAFMEKDEDEHCNVNKTVLQGMDVDRMFEEIDDQQNKGFYLDKLFNPQGPYHKQAQLFEKEKKNKQKRRTNKKSVNPRGNFLDKIDPTTYWDELADSKNYGIASLFESPKEKEIRLNVQIEKQRKKKYT